MRTSAIIDLCRHHRHRSRPQLGPHTANEMITAANATNRVIVVGLFGSVVAVWAAVEGMTLLPSKGSGFGEVHVLPLGTFSTYSYHSCDCDEIFFDFLTMTILHSATKEDQIYHLNHDEHWRP